MKVGFALVALLLVPMASACECTRYVAEVDIPGLDDEELLAKALHEPVTLEGTLRVSYQVDSDGSFPLDHAYNGAATIDVVLEQTERGAEWMELHAEPSTFEFGPESRWTQLPTALSNGIAFGSEQPFHLTLLPTGAEPDFPTRYLKVQSSSDDPESFASGWDIVAVEFPSPEVESSKTTPAPAMPLTLLAAALLGRRSLSL